MKAISILIHNEELQLPVSYQNYLQGIIYGWLKTDRDYADFIHNTGAAAGNSHFKMFTFSSLEGRSTYRNHTLIFHGNIRFEIRSADDYMIDLIEDSVSKNPYIRIDSAILSIVGYEVHAFVITADTVNIRMRTPVIARTTGEDKYVTYYRPDQQMFYQLIYTNALKKYEFVEHDDVPEFSMYPIKVSERDKVVAHYKDMVLTGWKGIYQLRGTSDLINFLYYTGLGERNGQGFGMFDFE